MGSMASPFVFISLSPFPCDDVFFSFFFVSFVLIYNGTAASINVESNFSFVTLSRGWVLYSIYIYIISYSTAGDILDNLQLSQSIPRLCVCVCVYLDAFIYRSCLDYIYIFIAHIHISHYIMVYIYIYAVFKSGIMYATIPYFTRKSIL